jgi:peptidoglycan/LPS O-acetylase OafA/YrhL/PAS domain-containing protein
MSEAPTCSTGSGRQHNEGLRYRPEIDGLRALAVISVILFHAGFQLFSGGFVGVDIFFVISGYLITAIILAELEAGRFSIAKFYERRARRILPPLFLVMATCLPFALLWLMPSDAKEFSKSVMAVLVFASNIFFWLQSDYFDQAAELKPLLHTWSLGIEEQFYVLFPVFLMFAWRLGRKRIVVLLAIMILLSLALAEYGTSRKPVATFFLLPTRGWELAMGSLIAFYLQGKERDHFPLVLYQILSLAGLGLVAYSLLAFTRETAFPGLSALIPTVGTGLIILFAVPGTLVGGWLVSRGLVDVGLVSYSAYLWHQPLLSFARHRSLTEPSDLVIASLVVLTFGLAYLTWRYVETPFRRKDIVTKGVLWRCSLASVVVIAISAGSLQLIPSNPPGEIPSEVAKLYRLRTCFFAIEQTFETLLENQCHLPHGAFAPVSSKQSGSSKGYVLYGDSVAAHLYPGLSRVVGQVAQLTAGSCNALRSGKYQRCNDFYDWFVNEYVPNKSMDAIIVSSDWFNEYNRVGEKQFRVELQDLFGELKGHRVIVYSQAASLSVDIRRYVHKLNNFAREIPENLEVRANNLTAVNTALREETAKLGFDFIDISQLFCSGDTCRVAKNGSFYFWDKIHLTLAGSVLVAEVTQSLLQEMHSEQSPSGPSKPTDRSPTDAFMVRNLDGTIRYWSDGAKKLYGWEPHDALERTSHELLKTVFPVPLEEIEEVLRVKGHWEGSLIHERSDGSKVKVTSHWKLQQSPRSQDWSATVIEINGPLPISPSGSFRNELLSLLDQPISSNGPSPYQKVS